MKIRPEDARHGDHIETQWGAASVVGITPATDLDPEDDPAASLLWVNVLDGELRDSTRIMRVDRDEQLARLDEEE